MYICMYIRICMYVSDIKEYYTYVATTDACVLHEPNIRNQEANILPVWIIKVIHSFSKRVWFQ